LRGVDRLFGRRGHSDLVIVRDTLSAADVGAMVVVLAILALGMVPILAIVCMTAYQVERAKNMRRHERARTIAPTS
jgi:hypothetical protein